MKDQKDWNSGFFEFSKKSRRGAIVLIVFFIIVSFGFAIWRDFVYSPNFAVSYLYIPDDDSMDFQQSKQGQKQSDHKKTSKKNEVKKINYPTERFNPNDLSNKDWQKMGFSQKQADVIVNFKNARDGFKTKEDLLDVFVIDSTFYVEIKKYIDLPNRADEASSDLKSQPQKDKLDENFFVELNQASTEELVKLKGIGEYRAKNIIKYRDALGGFYHKDQLLNVYGIPEEVFEEIINHVTVNDEHIHKMDLNSVSYEDLKKHPLINPNEAKSILDLREQINEFKSVDEVLQTAFIDLKKYKELKPYFLVSESTFDSKE